MENHRFAFRDLFAALVDAVSFQGDDALVRANRGDLDLRGDRIVEKTGLLNFKFWLMYTVPGPGNSVPSAAEMMANVNPPWAMRAPNRVPLA